MLVGFSPCERQSPKFSYILQLLPALIYNRYLFAAVSVGHLPVDNIALRWAKTVWSFGRSECNRVKKMCIIILNFAICGSKFQ